MFKQLNPFKTPPKAQVPRPTIGQLTADAFSAPEQKRVWDRIVQCYLIAEAKLGKAFPAPEVNFKLRGKSAGCAHLHQNKLRFNPMLLKENQQAFLDDVVPHEICHLLSYQLYGRVKPHGKEWQYLMRHLYQRIPSTTHSFDTRAVTGATFEYLCGCGPVSLSIRRHNKVLRGETQYRCLRCKQNLVREDAKG